MADGHATGPGDILLVAARLHLLLAAAIDDRHLLRAQQLRLHRRVDRRHAAADDDDAPADRQAGQIGGLPQFGDPANRVGAAGDFLLFKAERVDAGKAEPEKDGVIAGDEAGKLNVAAQHRAIFHRDAADRQDEIDFPLRKIIKRLVGGDAIFVEAARLVARLIDGDVMAMHSQPVGAGKAGRPGADDGDMLATGGGARKGLPATGRSVHHQIVRGMALQQPDLYRLAFRRQAHAGLFAQGLGRADAGAHAAHNVLGKDRLRRAARIVRRDLPDEQGDVDRSRASRHARRIKAEIAPFRLHHSLVPAQRRMQLGKILRIGFGRQPAGRDVGPVILLLQGHSSTKPEPFGKRQE